MLTCDIAKDNIIIAGLANGGVVAIDLMNKSNKIFLGSHNAPICRVFWCH